MPKAKISEEALERLRKVTEEAGLIDCFEEIKEIYTNIYECIEEIIKNNNHNKRVARI